MNERFIYLTEKFLDRSLTPDEDFELQKTLNDNPNLREELEEQQNIKGILNQMNLKNPSEEFWDQYWMGLYNRIERGIAWIAISIGFLILLGYAGFEFANSFFADNDTPLLIKSAIIILIFGLLILVISILRERFFTFKKDRYREIQR